jgi:hypothetical protein
MGYPQLFYNNPDQLSAWIFPPAVDVHFLGRWKELYFQNNHTNNKRDHYFQLQAIKNTTAPGIGQFGHELDIVHVGDAIEVEWNTRGEARSLTLKCIVCSLGKGNGTGGYHGVYDACEGCEYSLSYYSSYLLHRCVIETHKA